MSVSDPAIACLTVFHDGSCPLCQREIALAKRLTEGAGVAFFDVSTAGETEVVPGLNGNTAMRRFHVQRADGTLLSGAGAFLEMWGRSPNLSWLQGVARRPLLVAVLDRIYVLLLLIRPAISRFLRPIGR
jgi:predicted DCC family thiol-disulfide oxidoreductase YuxK